MTLSPNLVISRGNTWHTVYVTPNDGNVLKSIKLANVGNHNIKTSVAIGTATPTDVALASATLSGIPFVSRLNGTDGNAISIELIDPGAVSNLSVSVTGQKISVTLASDGSAITSTIGDVISAIQANSDANALVYIPEDELSSTSALATAVTETNLAGGVDDNVAYYILKDYSINKNSYLSYDLDIKLSKGATIFAKAVLPAIHIVANIEE